MSRKGMASVLAEVERAFGRPEDKDWIRKYTPERAAEYAGEVADLEAQLDEHWPAWRQREPFDKLPLEKRAWIKARLKRRSLILEGRGDWGVHMALVGGVPYAVPVKPALAESHAPAFGLVLSLPLLARDLKMTVAEIAKRLESRPVDVRDVRRWLVATAEEHERAPLPPIAAPRPSFGGAR